MQKVLRKYGVVILFYVVVVMGVLLLNTRFRYLNSQNCTPNGNVVAIQK